MKVAAVQMASGSSLTGNMLEAERLIGQAVEQGAQLVVLPENFGMICAEPQEIVAYAEKPGEGPLQDFMRQQASRHQIYLVGGSIPMIASVENKVRNTLWVYGPDGGEVARYDKIHLFDVTLPCKDEQYTESVFIEPGNEIRLIEAGGIRIGLAICYDLRFPELFRQLAAKGADVIVLPAAFTAETGKAHWHTLLKARAIENLSYVVASAQGGFHVNGRETYGHSLVADPWGNILAEVEQGPGVAVAEIKPAQQQQIRERFPVLQHIRI